MMLPLAWMLFSLGKHLSCQLCVGTHIKNENDNKNSSYHFLNIH